MADLQNTHAVSFEGEVVTKRFTDGKAGGAEREWRALTLLAEHAPGLAPAPIDFQPGVVVMSRLAGASLRGMTPAPAPLAGLAEALGAMHSAVPPRVLRDLPERPWQTAQLAAQVRAWCSGWRPRGGLADRAVKEGARWLDGWRPSTAGVRPAFGAGDGNLANFLWDGERVRVVDFEDSGRSDRAFELAELAEHVSAWVDGEVDVLASVELDRDEASRMRECRRLQALTWLFLLSGEGPRNPPGTFRRQVERVLRALDGA
ncbi:aminoglycoside phosphotransferase family protein [Nonomuraea sp. NPDC049152]|uniref:phosphotransferase family protein n=1 Tax=Nonomuraea sp. NPDC049152 TaxID=3154350 RepID=UPI0033E84572